MENKKYEIFIPEKEWPSKQLVNPNIAGRYFREKTDKKKSKLLCQQNEKLQMTKFKLQFHEMYL